MCGVVVGMGDACVWCDGGYGGRMCVVWWWVWGTHVCVVVVGMGDACVFTLHSFLCARI